MQDALTLVLPSTRYQTSYSSLVDEFLANAEALVPFSLAFDRTDFATLLVKFEDCARGVGVPAGFVAHSTYWLVRNDEEVVGVSNIRHALTPALLREGGNIGYGVRPSARGQGYANAVLRESLWRASALGLRRVLLTCGKQNVASAKTICRNGGVFDSEEFLAERGDVVQRYWIDCP